MFNNSDREPKFAGTAFTDISLITNRNGQTGIGIEGVVFGNDQEKIEQRINRMGEIAKRIGAGFHVFDGKKGNKSGKSFVSNWGSGSAWKRGSQNAQNN